MNVKENNPKNEGGDVLREVAPALHRYTETTVNEVWKRPDLSARDRSLITIATLIARNQAGLLSFFFNQALDNGVKAGEISETITHLAFYSGWGNAMAAISAAHEVFDRDMAGNKFLPNPANCCRLTKQPNQSERLRLNKTSARFHRAWCNTRANRCFTICGFARTRP